MKNKKIVVHDVWDGWQSLLSIEKLCHAHTGTHIVLDCAKEARLYMATGITENEDITRQRIVDLRNHNSVNGNTLSVIIGGYKPLPDHHSWSNETLNRHRMVSDAKMKLPSDNTYTRITDIHDKSFTDVWDLAVLYGLFDNIETWPNFFLTWQGHKILEGSYNNVGNLHDNYSNLFCLKNRIPKPHRLYLLNELERRDLLKVNQWSLLDPNDEWEEVMVETLGEQINDWCFTHGKKTFSQEVPEQLYRDQPGEYFRCFMEVVAETFSDVCFYTEKTTCPLLYRKPFLILGAPYINHDLQRMGFVLYDEVFDYSFDKIEDFRERSAAFADELLRLQNLKLDYKQVYIKLLPKLEHNLARVLKLMYHDEYMPRIVREYGEQMFNESFAFDPLGRTGWNVFVDNGNCRNQPAVDLIRKSKYLLSLLHKNYNIT